MDGFTTRQEHYCPFVQRNIVLEKAAESADGEVHFCLYSRDCNCGEMCQNKLLKLKIGLKKG